jgi:hypothetical protein
MIEKSAMLCYCNLSDEIEIIQDGKCCELCNQKDLHEFTPENVTKAFKFYQLRVSMLKKKLVNG